MICALYSLSNNSLDRRITLSIESPREFIQSTSFRPYGTRGQRNRCSHTVDEVNWANHGNPANGVLYQTLCSDRWCPYELALLKTKFPGSGFYFVSNLDRPGAGSQGCTEHQCFAYQLDQESYRTKHNEENCSCPEAFGDRRLVISLTGDGASGNLGIT